LEVDQAVGTGLGEPVHLGHHSWGELDAIRHDLLAVLVVLAARGLGVEQLAAGVGLGELARALELELVDAAHAAAVAQRFPLLLRHLGQRLALPERQGLLGGGGSPGAPDKGLSGHRTLLAYGGPQRRVWIFRPPPRAPARGPIVSPRGVYGARPAGFRRLRSTSSRAPARRAGGRCPSRRPPC